MRVVVVGGGLVGLSCAWACVQRGHDVTVVEAKSFGAGATHVAGGMLAPLCEAPEMPEGLLRFALDSAALYPDWVAGIERVSERSTRLRTEGTTLVAVDRDEMAELEQAARILAAEGMAHERVTVRQLRRVEPRLRAQLAGGYVAPAEHSVEPRALVASLVAALDASGATLKLGRPVIDVVPGAPAQVRLAETRLLADAVVLDLSRLLKPWADPAADPVELIVGRAKAGDVRDVLVGGRPVLSSGAPVCIDENALNDTLREALDANPPDPAARALQGDLHPWLMEWYARWDRDHADTHPPVQRYGARPLPTGKEPS